MTKEELEKRVHEFVVQVYKEDFEDGRADVKMRVESARYNGLEDAWECMRKILLSTADGGLDAEDLFEMFGIRSAYKILETVSVDEAMQKIKEYEEQQKQKCEFCFTEKLTKEKWASAKDCKKCKHFTDADEVHGYTPCGSCGADLHNFGPKQTDATDMNDRSIKVGDEVRIKGSDPVTDDCDYGVCTRSLPNINTMYVMRRDGSSGEENKDEWYRTGRFFPQIAEVLKLLRGDK